MKIAKWNQIMQKFQTKFGWERGTELMCKTARKVMFLKSVPDLNEREEGRLVNVLRKVYRENE